MITRGVIIDQPGAGLLLWGAHSLGHTLRAHSAEPRASESGEAARETERAQRSTAARVPRERQRRYCTESSAHTQIDNDEYITHYGATAMCESAHTLTNMVGAQRDTRTYTITHTVHDIKQQYGIMPGVYMVHEARTMDGTWVGPLST